MKIFPNGFAVTELEQRSMLHCYHCPTCVGDPRLFLLEVVALHIEAAKKRVLETWESRLFADAVAPLPADNEALLLMITLRSNFTSRAAQIEASPIEKPRRYNVEIYNGQHGRRLGLGTPEVAYFSQGIDVDQLSSDCVLHYEEDWENWVYGALFGQINKGKGQMIRQYRPVLMADSSVATFPADEDGLIQVITARADYKTVPEQLAVIPR